MNDNVERLGDWQAIPGASDRVNDLMRQNWALLDAAAYIINAGDPDPEELQDLIDESATVDEKLQATRAAEVENEAPYRAARAA
ncbi:hypothetical protein [Rhodococcoides fascians]|uniref:hypothetical protein n=1 Tax=Rhodococcoides fascians TaxID=1828 RepID=UPI00055DA45B|nr:hypothetical protein [Rhodococcus fascians]